VEKVALQKE